MVNVRKYTIYMNPMGLKYVGKNYVNQTSDFVQNGGLVDVSQESNLSDFGIPPPPKKNGWVS